MAEMGGQNVVGITIPAFVVPSANLTLLTLVTLVGCGCGRGSASLTEIIISLQDTVVRSYAIYIHFCGTTM